MSTASIRTGFLLLVVGLAGGLGLGLWQIRDTASQLQAQASADRERMQTALDKLDSRLSALDAVVVAGATDNAQQRNDMRARIQDLSLIVDDLRLVAQPMIAEIPEMPSAPQ